MCGLCIAIHLDSLWVAWVDQFTCSSLEYYTVDKSIFEHVKILIYSKGVLELSRRLAAGHLLPQMWTFEGFFVRKCVCGACVCAHVKAREIIFKFPCVQWFSFSNRLLTDRYITFHSTLLFHNHTVSSPCVQIIAIRDYRYLSIHPHPLLLFSYLFI